VEIQNQLKPLVDTMTRQGQIIRSLYSNGSGGPPGYLETARAEDKRDSEELFAKLDRLDVRLDITEEFILKHKERERQRDKDREDEAAQLAATVKSADRKFKRFIACWSLALAIFMALIALWDHWAAVRHVLLAPPAVVSQSQPETSTVPPQ